MITQLYTRILTNTFVALAIIKGSTCLKIIKDDSFLLTAKHQKKLCAGIGRIVRSSIELAQGDRQTDKDRQEGMQTKAGRQADDRQAGNQTAARQTGSETTD